MKQKKNLIEKITDDYQIIVRNYENLKDVFAIKFTYLRLIIIFSILIFSIFLVSIFFVRSIFKKLLNPAYIEQENKKRLIHLSKTINELEKRLKEQSDFIKLIQNNIDYSNNKEIPVINTNNNSNVVMETTNKGKKKSIYNSNINQFYFFTPVHGMVTSPFNPKLNHYGTDIVSKENAPIKTIADGNVVSSSWESENGWVIIIQHKENLISVYKHCSALLKKNTNFVRKGDVIAIIGNSGEHTTAPHLHFELWYNGKPLNPERYISFK